jgi:hypothetical protein
MAEIGVTYSRIRGGSERARHLPRFAKRTLGGSVDFCAWATRHDAARFGGLDLELPGGDFPRIASSADIEEFRSVFDSEIPRALEQVFATFPANELAIAFELFALRRENEALHEQVKSLADDLADLRQTVETLVQLSPQAWPSATDILAQVERDEEAEREFATIAAKRERYMAGLSADELEQQIRQLVEAEMQNPHHDLDS